MIVGELILKLGVVTSGAGALKQFEDGAKKSAVAATEVDKKTYKFGASIKDMRGGLEKGIKAIQGFRTAAFITAGAMTVLTKMASNAAAQLLRFEANTGLSAQRLQEWQQQAAASGVAASDLEDSIKGLQQAQTEINTFGGGNQAPWRFLGLDPRADPFTVLDKLHDKLKEFSPAVGTMWASQLGLSERMIAFVRERNKIPAADKELLLTTKELNNLKDFNFYFNRVWDNVKRSIQKFAVVMMPIATATTWVFDRLARALVTVSKWFTYLADRFSAYKGIFIAIGVALLVIFFPVYALIGLIIGAIEDLVAYSKGEKSIFGSWVQDLKDVLDYLKEIKETLSTKEGWKSLKEEFFGENATGADTTPPWMTDNPFPLNTMQAAASPGNSTVNYVTLHVDASGNANAKDVANKTGDEIKKIFPQTAPGHQ